MTSLIFYTSNYADLNAADAAATFGILIVDSAIGLSGNLTLATRQLTFEGGMIALGNYDLTSTQTVIDAPPVQIFSLSGSGRLKGRFIHPLFYPEWVGVQGVGPEDTDPYTHSAVFASANATLLQAIEDYAGQRAATFGGDVIVVKFTKYMTALSAHVTNPSPGVCAIWEGIDPTYTRIYCSGGQQPRLLTGASGSSTAQDCYRFLGLYGTGTESASLIDFQNWCGLTWRKMRFSNASGAIRMQSTNAGGPGWSENCGGYDCVFEADCGKPVQFITLGGTGSFRGWFLDGHNIWSVSTDSAPSFITHGNGTDGSDAYHGRTLNLVFTNQNTGKIFNLFDCQSATPISCLDGCIDAEVAGDGSIIRLLKGYSGFFGGKVYFSGQNFVYGGLVFAEQRSGAGTNSYLNRGSYYLEQLAGYRTDLSAGTNVVPQTASQQSIFHVEIYGGFAGTLNAQIVIDADPIGANHQITVLSCKVIHAASFAGFDATMFGVNSSAQLTITNANFPSGVFRVSGLVEAFGF